MNISAVSTAPASNIEEKGREKKESADFWKSLSDSSYDVFVNKQKSDTAAYAKVHTWAIHDKPTPPLLLWLAPTGKEDKGVMVTGHSNSDTWKSSEAGRFMYRPTWYKNFYSLTGGMNVVGKSDICLQYKHHKHYTTSLISSDVRFTILVAWHDLQPLHVISESFPAFNTTWAFLGGHNCDISRGDSLSKEPINIPEMHIYLTENAVPYRTSTPRQVPLRLQDEADSTISKLLKSGVIVHWLSQQWCAPAFFLCPRGRNKRGDGHWLYTYKQICNQTCASISVCSNHIQQLWQTKEQGWKGLRGTSAILDSIISSRRWINVLPPNQQAWLWNNSNIEKTGKPTIFKSRNKRRILNEYEDNDD